MVVVHGPRLFMKRTKRDTKTHNNLLLVVAMGLFVLVGVYSDELLLFVGRRHYRPRKLQKTNWLEEYIAFHNRKRSASKDGHTRYLLVEQGVGGLADRLKALPFFVRLAAKHNRVLLWHWDHPCPANKFLLPNRFDWTVPEWMMQEFDGTDNPNGNIHIKKGLFQLLNNAHNVSDYFDYEIGVDDVNVLDSQQALYLRVYSNHHVFIRGLPSLLLGQKDGRIFWSIFSAMFRLSPPVQALLDKTALSLGLEDANYVGVHLRARYPGCSRILDAATKAKGISTGMVDVVGFQTRTNQSHAAHDTAIEHELYRLAQNALHCTAQRDKQKRPGVVNQTLFYLSSDTAMVLDMYKHVPNVVYQPVPKERMHFGIPNRPCHEYYPALVDLWLLSKARCIGFGAGGFGMTASMMNGMECYTMHQGNDFCKSLPPPYNVFFCADPDATCALGYRSTK